MIKIKELMQESHMKAMTYSTIRNHVIDKNIFAGVGADNKPITQNTLFSACSISKLFATIAILQAKDEGILDLHQDINMYFKDFHLEGPSVTVHDLLIHQSGIEDCEGSYETYKITVGKPSVLSLVNGETHYIKEAVQVGQEPGKEFIYSDNNTLLLELLLEDIYGCTYREVILQKIIDPLKLSNSHYLDYETLSTANFAHGTSPDGHDVIREKNIYPYDSVAGLWTTSEDLTKVVIELLNSYHNRSNKLLKHETTVDMMIGKGCVDFVGYGVFVYTLRGKKVFYTQGWGEGFQCYLMAFLETGDAITVMTNQNSGVEQMEGPIGKIVNAFVDDCSPTT